MVKSADNGFGSVAPFLKKCYEMVDDESTDSLISWSKSNDSFIIWDMTEFSVRLLPKYFKHNNFSSFIRQLNIYGFRKTDTDRWEFANDDFIRGQKHLLKNILRRKHPHIAYQQKSSQQQENRDVPCQEVKNHNLWKEVENLKTDRNALTQELVKVRQHQESSKNKLLLLTNRLHGMEKNQQQMLSFLVMAMQVPGFMVQLLQRKENAWRTTETSNMLEHGVEDVQPVASDGMLMKYQPPLSEKLKPVVTPSLVSDEQLEPNLCTDGLKDFFINSDFLKVLMDEKLCQIDNHSPFILPDSPDDNAWERLLLGSPFAENAEDSNPESDRPTNNRMEIEPAICETLTDKSQNCIGLIPEMDKTQKSGWEVYANDIHLEKLQGLESLAEHMELLASEVN
ncbi:heat stress transcription factor A-8 [Prosopis cineraria]|uniref:heat stress transcription factor A-8 n=1 Tax=Prosopis cineraria TaxID=364024 RepID=UPI00240EEDFB|nr:heat stress transcription factor A-8 [Prosopis cineraria]